MQYNPHCENFRRRSRCRCGRARRCRLRRRRSRSASAWRMTGGLGPNGKSALLAQKIWEEDINAKGGLLGRPVKLIYYDDQTNPSTVPGIYTKLLDVDKVDLIIGGYATNMLAPAMPIVMQRKKTVHRPARPRREQRVQLPQLLRHDPVRARAEAVLHQGLLRRGHGAEPEADRRWRSSPPTPSSRATPPTARARTPRRPACKIVYDKTYPPPTDRLRADRARDRGDQPRHRRDLLLSARLGRHGARRQRDRLQAEDDRRRHGRAAEHLDQDAARAAAQRLHQLRLLAAGAEDAVPRRGRPHEEVPGARRQPRASIRSATTWRRRPTPRCRCCSRRSRRPRASTTTKLADYIRANTFKTVVGDVKFGKDGEWAEARVLQVQFQNVKGNDVDQFKDMTTQVVVSPAEYGRAS